MNGGAALRKFNGLPLRKPIKKSLKRDYVLSWCVFTVWLEHILSKTAERNQTKEASPPPLAGTRHPPPPAEPSSRWRRRLFQIQKFPILQFVRIVFVSFIIIIPPLSININDDAAKYLFTFFLLLFDIFCQSFCAFFCPFGCLAFFGI